MKSTWGWAVVSIGLSGCFSSGLYRTAETLEPGEFDVTIGVNALRLGVDKAVAEASAEEISEEAKASAEESVDPFWVPNVIPEIGFHAGLIDDLELGGRLGVGSMMIELDAKYRIIGHKGGLFHLAVQPAVNYRTLFVVSGYSAMLPLITTFTFNENIALNLAGYAGYQSYSVSLDALEDYLGADGKTFGGNVGVRFSVDDFYFMPAVDYSRTTYQSSTESDGATIDLELKTEQLVAGIYIGLTFGGEAPPAKPVEPAPTTK